jgi:hypothetical protein
LGRLQRQAGVQVTGKGVQFDEGFRADILVDRQLIVEIEAVSIIVPAHDTGDSGPATGCAACASARDSISMRGNLRPARGELSSDQLRTDPWFLANSISSACKNGAHRHPDGAAAHDPFRACQIATHHAWRPPGLHLRPPVRAADGTA